MSAVGEVVQPSCQVTQEDEAVIWDGGAVREEDHDALICGDVGDVAGAILVHRICAVGGEGRRQLCEHGGAHPVVERHGEGKLRGELRGGRGVVDREYGLRGRGGAALGKRGRREQQQRGDDAVEQSLRRQLEE